MRSYFARAASPYSQIGHNLNNFAAMSPSKGRPEPPLNEEQGDFEKVWQSHQKYGPAQVYIDNHPEFADVKPIDFAR